MLLRISSRKRQYLFSQPRRSKAKWLSWLIPILMVGAVCSYKQIESYFVQPDAILVLGGEEERELFAAKFSKQYPELHIWVSSGSPEWYTQKVFAKAGVPRTQLHIDHQATDTVTNFTTLVDELKAQGIDSVYLITSDDHMRRARVIGEIVFGSRGIVLKPIPVALGREPEPIEKCVRDGARALLWVATGHTGANLSQISGILER
ncbi:MULTISPECIES: YdcF family protein [unclassified Coleofasciculus]|uniref:YdcF family protein n=1 Tax=unclassified Coleofasciculus TaxID=2692782 RepID=UPI00187F6797|nr:MULTISPECIES: YdcF family protein [unclassified Coleofasciculus]MBE9127729.1 YdcF family protein [Coleofasciculus sp. LEGE 07081]MBE9150697.1 YdcF family protein [Coleofasciculus sp. LEGE 07092]